MRWSHLADGVCDPEVGQATWPNEPPCWHLARAGNPFLETSTHTRKPP